RYRSVSELRHMEFRSVAGLLGDRTSAVRIVGEKMMPGGVAGVSVTREALALSPEHVIITALDAPDARREPATVIQSIPQDVIGFTVDGASARLFLSKYTHLPTAIEYSGPA